MIQLWDQIENSLIFQFIIYNDNQEVSKQMAQTSSTNTSKNIFLLSRFKKDCYYQPVYVDFNPIKRINNVYKRVIPSFNSDKKFYTSAFVTQYDQFKIPSHPQVNDSTEKEYFQRRVRENLSKPEMLTPVFSAEGVTYCSVCSKHFQCYLDHINLPSHTKKIKSLKANAYIHELCQQFNGEGEVDEKVKNRDHESKTKKIKKDKKNGRKENKESERNQDLIIRWPPQVLSFFSEERKTFHLTPNSNGVEKLIRN